MTAPTMTSAPVGSGLREPALTVEGLTKSFTLHAVGRHARSLTDVSFTLYRGEHLAVAGASGAGKSSMLRCIYRSYLPDAGTITMHGQDGPIEISSLSDRDMARHRGLQFGYVSQFLQAPPRRGPLRLVSDAALRRGMDRETARDMAADSLQRLGIDEKLWEVDCAVLSGGERQRVNLAAGTVSPPELLLLDEPVASLDPANTERALELIEGLRAQDVAVLAVYHDMDIIRRLADRVIVMSDGQIVADGAPKTVLDAYEGKENHGV